MRSYSQSGGEKFHAAWPRGYYDVTYIVLVAHEVYIEARR